MSAGPVGRRQGAADEMPMPPPPEVPVSSTAPPGVDIAAARRARDQAFVSKTREWQVQEARNLANAALHASGRTGGIPPQYIRPKFNTPDETEVSDYDGLPAGDPSCFQKWVPMKGSDGKDSDTRIQRHKHEGYRDVVSRNPATPGKLFEGHLGRLMEIDGEGAATRQAVYMPGGGVSPQMQMQAQVEMAVHNVYASRGMQPGAVEIVEDRQTRSNPLTTQ